MRRIPIYTLLLMLLLFGSLGCSEPEGTTSVGDNDAAPDFDTPDLIVDGSDDEIGSDDMPVTVYEPPLGTNPALGYGPYAVTRTYQHVNDGEETATYYLYKPEGVEGPLPTIIWGHGIWASERPKLQREMYVRLASHGFLVVYPNLDVPFPFLHQDTVQRSVGIFLRTARQAVWRGWADPDRIMFGGYSYGGRIAALATAWTGKLDPLNIWPNPVACVYEAMADFNTEGYVPIELPGPQAVDFVQYIDPEIPQTIIVAEGDQVVWNWDKRTDAPLNGVAFYEAVQTDFAQLIILHDGTTWRDKTSHATFMMPTPGSLDAHDLWGHFKILAGAMQYHFHAHSKEWAYGFMRSVGGRDSDGVPIRHEIHQRGQLTPDLNDPEENGQDETQAEEPSAQDLSADSI